MKTKLLLFVYFIGFLLLTSDIYSNDELKSECMGCETRNSAGELICGSCWAPTSTEDANRSCRQYSQSLWVVNYDNCVNKGLCQAPKNVCVNPNG